MTWNPFKLLWSWFTGPEYSDDVEAVRIVCVRICGFLPTAATAAAVLTMHPVVISVSAAAHAICGTINRGQTFARLLAPNIDGVAIEGEYVDEYRGYRAGSGCRDCG